MIKASIFLDIENLSRNGGWGIQYDVIKDLVTAQDAVVLRANAYWAIDVDREGTDAEYRRKFKKHPNVTLCFFPWMHRRLPRLLL